jgi:RNA polymerase sigma factor (sigma-70 family)
MKLLGRPSDTSLVDGAVAVDSRSVETLVMRYQRKAYAVVRTIAFDSPAVDDIVQEAFLLALENLGKLRVRASFGPWFLQIVRNVARRAYRQGPICYSVASASCTRARRHAMALRPSP